MVNIILTTMIVLPIISTTIIFNHSLSQRRQLPYNLTLGYSRVNLVLLVFTFYVNEFQLDIQIHFYLQMKFIFVSFMCLQYISYGDDKTVFKNHLPHLAWISPSYGLGIPNVINFTFLVYVLILNILDVHCESHPWASNVKIILAKEADMLPVFTR